MALSALGLNPFNGLPKSFSFCPNYFVDALNPPMLKAVSRLSFLRCGMYGISNPYRTEG
jgi:hypothetical protein